MLLMDTDFLLMGTGRTRLCSGVSKTRGDLSQRQPSFLLLPQSLKKTTTQTISNLRTVAEVALSPSVFSSKSVRWP